MSFCIRLIGPVGKALLVVGAAGGLGMALILRMPRMKIKKGWTSP
jgi:NADPH:quinone reductase-like Zn-dependent oxidoreductase